ncbi:MULTISPECIES: hypothetical protein [unclassified Streptomyces]|uniref:hypothetical protein n=1 Tax=unclassified Streptomyces TaxID=2593676 RepID=UPI00020E6A80|nr:MULTISPECIES: hypothetical protein [unclassified Streptomyces]EGJ78796.1 hypothetical protein STTU_6007 [Streptomyces sp. Tu6071]
MPNGPEPGTTTYAERTLRLAGRTGSAAPQPLPQPWPRWFAPARGVLGAAVFALGGAPWPARAGDLTGALLCVLAAAFVVVHYVAVRRSRVLAWPGDGGSTWERLTPTLVQAALYGAGWLLAPPLGRTAGALASGALLGATLWTQTALHDARARAARRAADAG